LVQDKSIEVAESFDRTAISQPFVSFVLFFRVRQQLKNEKKERKN
jgi:hypothetical protein